MLHFLDTNILLYSISTNPTDASKRERAIALLGRDDGALSVQVLQEFYVQAMRATRPHPLSHDSAWAFLLHGPALRSRRSLSRSLRAHWKSKPRTGFPTMTARSSPPPAPLDAVNSIPRT